MVSVHENAKIVKMKINEGSISGLLPSENSPSPFTMTSHNRGR